jgi:hypothetical protein
MVKIQTEPTHSGMMAKLLSALGWEIESSIPYDDDYDNADNHHHHHTSQHLPAGKPSPIPDCVWD